MISNEHDEQDKESHRLRAAAETRLRLRKAAPAEAPARSADEILHELQVHQIELEMQNEALRRSQIDLEASRDRYVDFYDFAPVGYLTLDDAGLIAEINLTGAAMLGTDRAKLPHRRFSPFVADADRDRWHRRFMSAMQQDGKLDFEVALTRPDGSRLDVRLDCLRLAREDKASALRVVLTDITERKQAAALLAQTQAQLLQAEKMAAIGQLAAGVAHEINNPIGFVLSNFFTLQEYTSGFLQLLDAYRFAAESGAAGNPALADADRRAAEFDLDFARGDVLSLLADSKDGLDRVRRIVRDLLDFSHVDEGEWQTTDLHACLDGTLKLARNALKSRVTLVKDYGKLPAINCLPAQLSQAFMNLLINAAQAVDESGTITLRTGHEGDEVWIELEDTGAGIAPEILPHIFEPFFTTKPVGLGTGLGMAVSHGIVQSHKGRIDVRSEVGKGTRFTIWLPINPGAADDGANAVSPAPSF